jgi:hypothetical protein
VKKKAQDRNISLPSAARRGRVRYMGKQMRRAAATIDEIAEETAATIGNAIVSLRRKGISTKDIVRALALAIVQTAESDPDNHQDHLDDTAAILKVAAKYCRAGEVNPLDAIFKSLFKSLDEIRN